MNKNKDLLKKDLSARLPYGVMVQCITESARMTNASPLTETLNTVLYRYVEEDNIELKPYLRPMSSMTEEEEIEYDATFATIKMSDGHYDSTMTYKSFDWLNAHHFDYRGLIEKGLAIEAPEGMYVY